MRKRIALVVILAAGILAAWLVLFRDGERATPRSVPEDRTPADAPPGPGEEAGLAPESAPEAPMAPEATPEWRDLLAKVNAAASWRAAVPLVAGASSEQARWLFPRIEDDLVRAQLLEEFAPLHDLELLHLAAQDPAERVRKVAFEHLRSYALLDFVGQPDLYPAWREKSRGRPLAEVLGDSLEALGERLESEADFERELQLPLDSELFEAASLPLGTAMREAGVTEELVRFLSLPARPSPGRRNAWIWLAWAGPDEELAEQLIRPILANPAGHAVEFISVLETLRTISKAEWAFQALVRLLHDQATEFHMIPAIGFAFVEWKDPRAIPHWIRAMNRDPRVPGFVLSQLTGEELHDAAWWTAWWEENRERFPEEVRQIPVR